MGKNSWKKEYEELSDKLRNNTDALIVLKKKLPPDFWKELDLDQLIGIFITSRQHPDIRKMATIHLKEIKADFKTWFHQYLISLNQELKAIISDKLIETASSFDDWRNTSYYIASEDKSKKFETCFDKMFELAKSFSQWKTIYALAKCLDKKEDQDFAREIAWENMSKLAKNIEESIEIYDQKPTEENLHKVLSIASAEKDQSLDKWIKIYQASDYDSPIKVIALEKITEIKNKT